MMTATLHGKLAQVMYEVERIPKNGSFKQPGEYGHFKFVQAGDAADVIRKALAEQKVSMIPSAIDLVDSADHLTDKGKTMTTVTVRTTWTLTDGDSGETATIQSMGSGADMGDKAIPKAQTNAMKYALLMGFMLSTGDDPELSDTSDRQRRAPSRPVGVHAEPPDRPQLTREVHDGLIGTFAVSGTQDGQLRETPDGWVLPFRLKSGSKAGQICLAHDYIAKSLANRGDLTGQRVTVWGTFEDLTIVKGEQEIGYKVLHLSRITGDGFDLVPEPTEPPTDGLSAEEQAAMDELPW